jgi:RNA polymerase sigma factor (sigma-70 family)
MPGGTTHPVGRFLRTLAAPGDAPDAQLLTRFADGRDEAAFAALVRRHGPMVLGVCARVLGDSADAEDAFQATFLVLVRRAGSVGRPDLLASWLYGVAHRTALRTRSDAARRRRHEGCVPPPAAESGEADWRDLRPVLDEELNRLPDKYRVPLVLCHLEGVTHEEAARRLGCPRETVTTRITRGRERLRQRLVQRGVMLSAGGLAVLLTENAAAAVTPEAAAGVVRAALHAGASARVVALTERVVRAMWLARLKMMAALVVGLGLVACGVGALARHALADEPAAQVVRTPDQPAEPAAKEQDGDATTVKSMPPVVVKAEPQAGDTKVDAARVKEIRVTFSKDMADQSWSWAQMSAATFPKIAGKIRYEADKRTCVLPVELQPGRTYVLWVNSQKFGNFKDADGIPAVPYLLVFETKP